MRSYSGWESYVNPGGIVREEELDHLIFVKKAVWRLERPWWPRRCYYTNQLLWFKPAYQGTADYDGPGSMVTETKWAERDTFMIRSLSDQL